MADTSGSMRGLPIATSIGLAIYFAERNLGVYKDLFLTFSSTPQFITLKGTTLREKVACIPSIVDNTDLERAFELILKTAIQNNIPEEEMPVSLVIISDMQFDGGQVQGGTFNDSMKRKFANAGYMMPNVVYWNVNGDGTFQAKTTTPGVQLYSGQSASVFKSLLSSIGKTAYQAMLDALNDSQYDVVKI